ncbi:unannotated protein [freshwater metagenome]|uniref:Unannotated protein n=1 Tax=freshwater metagenome TaxID=449393 RepID=A0A6J7FT90_9ZZZZ|nr:sterol desaturase family protein [Actinomycetota bacterium]
MDLSVAATPLYLGSMVLEDRALRRRAHTRGSSPADYFRPDTIASLAMGIGSVIVPITEHLGRLVVPGKGRFGKVLLRTALSAVVITTIADRVAARAPATETGQRLSRRARRVAGVGGVTAVAAGGLALTTTASYLGDVQRLWAKGQHRDLGNTPLAWAIALVGWDFAYYWNHRFMHEVRAMWAIHVVHHSSEHYNLSTALRQPVASAFGVWVPVGLMARLGVRPSLIEHSRAINLIYQFWIHTDLIDSLGPAEEVLNTPSHHRAHHGSNRRYLDRNHGGILITWDRLFGTFQREDPSDPVVYGLTKNIGTHNLFGIATHEYRDMFRDVARSTNWRDRLSFVLRGPGWAATRRQQAEVVTASGAS